MKHPFLNMIFTSLWEEHLFEFGDRGLLESPTTILKIKKETQQTGGLQLGEKGFKLK